MNWTAALALMTSPALAAPTPGVSWDWQLSDPIQPPQVAVFDAAYPGRQITLKRTCTVKERL